MVFHLEMEELKMRHEQHINWAVNDKILSGTLHIPENNGLKRPGIVLCHGFGGNKIGLHRIFVKAARCFCAAGYYVLRFDFSGCGESEGEHRDITIDTQVKETLSAVRYLKNIPMVSQENVFLVGLSMGGAVAALAAPHVNHLKGLVMWAPVAKMYEDIHGLVGNEICEKVWTEGTADYMGFELGEPFLSSLQKNHPLETIKTYDGPALIIHGTADVEISHINTDLYKEARQHTPCPTNIHLVKDADHTFSGLSWENEVFQITLHWLRKHGSKQKLIFNEKETLTG